MALDRFYISGANTYIAFVELTRAQMLSDVPLSLPASTEEDDEGNTVRRKVYKWVTSYRPSIDDQKAIVAIQPRTHSYGRRWPVSLADMQAIKTWIEGAGLPELNWMTWSEAKQYYKDSPDYENQDGRPV